jgi:hypothetical protein
VRCPVPGAKLRSRRGWERFGDVGFGSAATDSVGPVRAEPGYALRGWFVSLCPLWIWLT